MTGSHPLAPPLPEAGRRRNGAGSTASRTGAASADGLGGELVADARPPAAGPRVTWTELPLLILVAATPVLLFPGRWPGVAAVALLALPLSCLLLLRTFGRIAPTPAVGWSLAALLTAVCVSSVQVRLWDLALPKIVGLGLAATTLVVLVRALGTRRALARAVLLLDAAAVALAVIGVLFADWTTWSTGKISGLDPLYAGVAHWVERLAPGRANIRLSPNELAGVLVLFPPLFLAQAMAGVEGLTADVRGRRRHVAALACSLAGALVVIAVQITTQSRSGLLGTAVTLVLLVVWVARWSHRSTVRRVWIRMLVAAFLFALVGGALLLSAGTVGRWVESASALTMEDTLSVRLALWKRSLDILVEVPLTGIGLGQFSAVLYEPYQSVPHSHNLFLEYALTLGIPGALACGWLLTEFYKACGRATRSPDNLYRWSAVGIALGFTGFLVYGLLDAIGPGARGSYIHWCVLAYGLALGELTRSGDAGGAGEPGGAGD